MQKTFGRNILSKQRLQIKYQNKIDILIYTVLDQKIYNTI